MFRVWGLWFRALGFGVWGFMVLWFYGFVVFWFWAHGGPPRIQGSGL